MMLVVIVVVEIVVVVVVVVGADNAETRAWTSYWLATMFQGALSERSNSMRHGNEMDETTEGTR